MHHLQQPPSLLFLIKNLDSRFPFPSSSYRSLSSPPTGNNTHWVHSHHHPFICPDNNTLGLCSESLSTISNRRSVGRLPPLSFIALVLQLEVAGGVFADEFANHCQINESTNRPTNRANKYSDQGDIQVTVCMLCTPTFYYILIYSSS